MFIAQSVFCDNIASINDFIVKGMFCTSLEAAV